MENTKTKKKQTRSSFLVPSRDKKKKDKKKIKVEKEEAVFGSKFFGGSAVKEELFEEYLTDDSTVTVQRLYPEKIIEDNTSDDTAYFRYRDITAFPDEQARKLGMGLQKAVNEVLYEASEEDNVDDSTITYSPFLKWETPLPRSKASRTPLDELVAALDFYERIDVAIISCQTFGTSTGALKDIGIRWEISLLWPNAWKSRLLLTGSSTLTVDTTTTSWTILSQKDKLDTGGKDGQDLIKAVYRQLLPRFWDLYHIGMTPCAELMSRCQHLSSKKGLFSRYTIFEMPPRLVYQPTILDIGGRSQRNAQIVPNHAFCSQIKTAGASEQRYLPTTPVEVALSRSRKGTDTIISWNIAIPPECVNYSDTLPLPGPDEETDVEMDQQSQYIYQPRRLCATLQYGGNPQDEKVTDLRKSLYNQVTKDGYKPKLVNGRPKFFFLQNDAKACFTADGGLGMVVYDWRLELTQSNEVGIELELE